MKRNISSNEYLIASKVLSFIKGRKLRIADLGGSVGNLDYLFKTTNLGIINVDYNDGDITQDLNSKIELKDSSMDYVLALNIIEHLDNPNGFLLDCKRILKTKGKLILITPNGIGLQEIMTQIGFNYPGYKKCPYTHHIYIWNKFNMDRLMERAGFKIVNFEFMSYYWNKNILFKFISWLIPIHKPFLFYVCEKEKK